MIVKTNWNEIIQQESEKEYFKKIFLFLSNATKNILPNKENIFNAFNFFDKEELKIVIIGQDPYPNKNHAHGLCFSCKDSELLPASLRNIFKELDNDLHIKRTNSNLIDWATQGILLLNRVLTVFEDELIHIKILDEKNLLKI